MKFYAANRRSDYIAVAVTLIVTFLLAWVDLHPARDPEPGSKEKAIVLQVDNRDLTRLGLLTTGSQKLEIRILGGKFAGEVFPAVNQLRANLELDKTFAPGDTVLAAVLHDAVPGETVLNAQDHYRIGNTLLLFGSFVLLLLCFGGLTGAKALVSFLFCCAVIWKLVVPLCLRGYHAVWIAVAAVSVLTAVILFLVAGCNRKGIAACAGAMLAASAGEILSFLWNFISFRI
ncbi:MAG: YibE/F family protein, partial [Lentisphaeria bacterium]|nr:YibE/F family protein [Lentisphaeria bacterium]